jgi:hypothetical protein
MILVREFLDLGSVPNYTNKITFLKVSARLRSTAKARHLSRAGGPPQEGPQGYSPYPSRPHYKKGLVMRPQRDNGWTDCSTCHEI